MSKSIKIWGYRRENGRVGVRNYVAILPVDDISNAACESVANNIRGTIALPNGLGKEVTVAVFAQGPIGLCATAGAKLSGATTIIGVDSIPERLEMARRLGADHIVNYMKVDPVEEILRITHGRGVDIAIEALGLQSTFEACLRVLRPGGRLSSLGVYSSDLRIPLAAFTAGLGDHTIVTTLCPGGKERMRRLMAVIASGRIDLKPLVTHRFKLDEIERAYELFANQRDGVLKVAITP